LVILTNRYSASASEIVAGALQDKSYKRAVIVGERTHGKGSVQGITPYPGDKAQLKYTMAYYHLPSGQRVESRSDEMKKMIDVQRDNDVLVQANMAGQHKSLKKRGLEKTLESDPQLSAGLLIIKSKLIQLRAQEAASKLAQL
jgi:carboxyl-terminal processing protease